MYSIIRKLLFKLDPERAHAFTLGGMKLLDRMNCLSFFFREISLPKSVMGLTFSNSIGLAAGLDKNAEYVDALSKLGFGFIEVGTVTPKPQIGNPKPRLFRLVEDEALINRMGFNSKGVLYVAKQLEKIRFKGVLGINIGKNKETPMTHAIDDYLFCFHHLCQYASYITINISSPNTENLRDLHERDALIQLLSALKAVQKKETETKKYVPLVVKISPDLNDETLASLAAVLLEQKIDSVIATNTTVARENLQSPFAHESGGLSGKPLSKRSTEVIRVLASYLNNDIPIIASGGIMSEIDVKEKQAAGAQLFQIYTGLIYHGPRFIRNLQLSSQK